MFLRDGQSERMREEFERQFFPVYFENQWVLADGSIRDLAWSSTVVRGEHDAVSYIVSSGDGHYWAADVGVGTTEAFRAAVPDAR